MVTMSRDDLHAALASMQRGRSRTPGRGDRRDQAEASSGHRMGIRQLKAPAEEPCAKDEDKKDKEKDKDGKTTFLDPAILELKRVICPERGPRFLAGGHGDQDEAEGAQRPPEGPWHGQQNNWHLQAREAGLPAGADRIPVSSRCVRFRAGPCRIRAGGPASHQLQTASAFPHCPFPGSSQILVHLGSPFL